MNRPPTSRRPAHLIAALAAGAASACRRHAPSHLRRRRPAMACAHRERLDRGGLASPFTGAFALNLGGTFADYVAGALRDRLRRRRHPPRCPAGWQSCIERPRRVSRSATRPIGTRRHLNSSSRSASSSTRSSFTVPVDGEYPIDRAQRRPDAGLPLRPRAGQVTGDEMCVRTLILREPVTVDGRRGRAITRNQISWRDDVCRRTR